MTEDSEHIAVVFAGQSERWATWVEDELVSAGFPTQLVRWDPLRRPPAGTALTDLLSTPGHRVLLVLDDWYVRFDTGRYRAWADVLQRVLQDHPGRITAISVTTRPLPEATRELHPAELRGVGRDEARRRLLGLFGVRVGPRRGVDLDRTPRFPDDLPPVWNVPRRNRRFTGRVNTLERLRSKLTAGPDGTAVVALHGPAGTGKTQVALEYAHRYAGDYDIVWWVTATATSTARENFAALAPELGTGDGSELRALIAAVHHSLRTNRRRWLIVLDGAEDPERLADLIPEGDGHVLITTHRAAWSAHGADLVELPRFHRQESIAYACRRAERLSEREADQLSAALEDLPLLIDQMAAWLDAHPTTVVSDYVDEIRDGDPNVFGVVPSGDEPRPFRAVWAMAVNTLHDEVPEAYELLKLFVFFSADVVPVRLLQSARAADLPPHLARLTAEPSSWNSALRALSESTSMWLEYETGPGLDVLTVGTLRMHRLFHRFVRACLPAEDRKAASDIACRVLVAADPREPSQPRNWVRYAELIPHLEPSGALESDDEDVRRLVLNCIEYLRMRGEYRDGWIVSRTALENWRATSGETDRTVLVAAHQYANMLRRMGRYADAESLGRDVLGRLTAARGEGIEVLRAMNGLGGTLMALGKYDEARQLYEKAVHDSIELLGDRNVPRTLALRTNLATAVALQGHYEESLAQHRSVMEARVTLFGGKNALTLLSALHTAWLLRLLGRYREALVIQEQNVRLHSQVLDREHSQTLLAEHNLALCMRREGNLEFARAMMRKVRDRLARRHGNHHPESLLVATDYAMLLREAGELEPAYELAESTARLYGLQLGEDHPYAIGSRDNCAVILRDLGDHDAALRLSEDVLGRMSQALGESHTWSVGCAMNTASARAAAGDVEGAVVLGRSAVERAVARVGERHVLTVNLMAGLAQDLSATGERSEAELLAQEAVTRLTEALGDEHPQIRYMKAGRRPYWDFEPQPI